MRHLWGRKPKGDNWEKAARRDIYEGIWNEAPGRRYLNKEI